jgi:short-subunit dehydrogenase
MKNILITGGSSGIGYELVKLFSAHRSWHVITCSRTESKNQMLRSFSEEVDAYTVDLGKPEQRSSFLDEIMIKYSLNALILNAAISGVGEVDHQETDPEYVTEVNLNTNIAILEKMLPRLRKSNGIVVFISTAIFNEPDHDPVIDLYAETKKKCEEYILKIAKEQENQTVQFLIIRPGMTATRLHRNILAIGTGKLFERTKKAVEQRKLRNPYVVAKIIKNFVTYSDLAKNKVIDISETLYQEALED